MKGAARMEEQEVDALTTNCLNTNQASIGGKQSRSRGWGARNCSRRQSCRRCGTWNECPAWGESCLKCGGPSHFSSQHRTVDQNLNEMVNQGSSENEFFVDCLYIENTSSKDSSACFFLWIVMATHYGWSWILVSQQTWYLGKPSA